jgi:hypothetical protein
MKRKAQTAVSPVDPSSGREMAYASYPAGRHLCHALPTRSASVRRQAKSWKQSPLNFGRRGVSCRTQTQISLRRSHCSKSMPLARLSLSDRVVATLPLAASGQQIARDSDLAGFFVLIGTRSKTYMIQSDIWENGRRRTLRVKIGEADRGFGSRAREARVGLARPAAQSRFDRGRSLSCDAKCPTHQAKK